MSIIFLRKSNFRKVVCIKRQQISLRKIQRITDAISGVAIRLATREITVAGLLAMCCPSQTQIIAISRGTYASIGTAATRTTAAASMGSLFVLLKESPNS